MSHIWVPKCKILEGEMAQPPHKLRGFFTMTRRKADTLEEIQTVGPFENLITNNGLNMVGTTAPDAVGVGTGTTPPSVSDTALQSEVALTTGVSGAPIIRNPAIWPTVLYTEGGRTYRFAAGLATGTLTEVGVGKRLTGPERLDVYSRALIVDGDGDPVSITVLADEILDVTYVLRHYLPVWEDASDDVDTILTLSGIDYDVKMRPSNVNSSGGWGCYPLGSVPTIAELMFRTGTAAGTPPSLGAVTDTLVNPGSVGSPSDLTAVSYVDSSLTRETTVTAALGSANLAYGLRGVEIGWPLSYSATAHLMSRWQATITPAIPKDDTKILSFGISMSWARHTP